MQNDEAEKYRRFLLLFGLPEQFSDTELTAAYRTLAKLNHPDLHDDTTSLMRMTIVNEAYRFLREVREKGLSVSIPVVQPKKEPDIYYKQYRKAFDLLQSAFSDYFGEDAARKINEADLPLLQERLRESKKEFSRIVNEFEYNTWTDDSIDKICSINKWLA